MIKVRFLILNLVLLVNVSTISSQTFSEKAYLLCKYSFKSVSDTNKRERIRDEFVTLEIGKSGSYYYSINYDNYEKASEDFRKNHAGEKMAPGEGLKMIKKMGTPLIIYKNYTNNLTVCFDKIGQNYYTFEELSPTFNWTIEVDTMKILNQICQKATCRFKGRSYEAWFAQGINVSEGPWKFNGLPGLILKIRDLKNDYSFEAVAIEKNSIEISHREINAKKVSKEQYLKIYQYYLITPMMGENIEAINPNIAAKLKGYVLPYNPIELTDN